MKANADKLKSETLKAQAHRACATVAEVLGRDPKVRARVPKSKTVDRKS